jgi:predicted transcriptional regulator
MTTVSIRLPDSLHETVRKLSKKEHVSINQFVATAIAEKISSIMTEDYLSVRAKRGSRAKFVKAMSKVSD